MPAEEPELITASPGKARSVHIMRNCEIDDVVSRAVTFGGGVDNGCPDARCPVGEFMTARVAGVVDRCADSGDDAGLIMIPKTSALA